MKFLLFIFSSIMIISPLSVAITCPAIGMLISNMDGDGYGKAVGDAFNGNIDVINNNQQLLESKPSQLIIHFVEKKLVSARVPIKELNFLSLSLSKLLARNNLKLKSITFVTSKHRPEPSLGFHVEHYYNDSNSTYIVYPDFSVSYNVSVTTSNNKKETYRFVHGIYGTTYYPNAKLSPCGEDAYFLIRSTDKRLMAKFYKI